MIVTQSRYVKTLTGSLGNGDPRFQLRTLLKACVTRDLALRYSVSGRDSKGQYTKLCFKDTALCKVMEQAIATKLSLTRKKFYTELGFVLKAAVDWDGHRGKRRTESQSLGSEPEG